MIKLKMIEELINSFKKYEDLSSNIFQYIDSNETSNDKEDFFNEIYHQIEMSKSKTRIAIQILTSIYKENNATENPMNKKIIQLFSFLQSKELNLNKREIFDIIKSKKTLLLYLYEHEIIITKEFFNQEIVNLFEFPDFLQFFSIEFQKLNQKEFDYLIQKLHENQTFIEEYYGKEESFIKKRREGVNDKKFPTIIRKDLFDDFTSFVSQSNFNLNSKIENSFFENFSKGNKKIEPSLIEYAAYHGSHTIFKYLLMKDVQISNNLFWFAINGRNYEIIHLIENYQNKLNYDNFVDCYNEAIKCHYNEIAVYVEETFLKEKIPFSSIETCIRSFNIQMMIRILENNQNILKKQSEFNLFFFYMCEYGYTDIVEVILKNINQDFLKEKDSQILLFFVLMIINDFYK